MPLHAAKFGLPEFIPFRLGVPKGRSASARWLEALSWVIAVGPRADHSPGQLNIVDAPDGRRNGWRLAGVWRITNSGAFRCAVSPLRATASTFQLHTIGV